MANNRANFRINPANALGLEAEENRSKLVALALSKPENYHKLKAKVYNSVTTVLATEIYDMYWDLLTLGRIKRYVGEVPNTADGWDGIAGNVEQWQLVYPAGANMPFSGQPFQPKLPEAEVNICCSEISEEIKTIAKRIIQKIMPDDHLKLAQQKEVDLINARGH